MILKLFGPNNKLAKLNNKGVYSKHFLNNFVFRWLSWVNKSPVNVFTFFNCKNAKFIFMTSFSWLIAFYDLEFYYQTEHAKNNCS